MTQTVPETPYIEDVIVLDDWTLPVKGIAQGNALSEFEVGLKTGNINYDNRTQAFYVVMDDFSGGFGHRFFDQRAQKDNTFWDYPLEVPAADTRRPQHITLGPQQNTIAPVTQPTAAAVPVNATTSPSYPYWGFQGRWQYAFGTSIYETSDGLLFTQRLNSVGPVTNLGAWAPSVVPQCGAIALYSAFKAQFVLYAAFPDNQYYISFDEGRSWTPGVAPEHFLDDMIFWDQKIIAAQDNIIIFGIRSTSTTPVAGAEEGEKLVSFTVVDESFDFSAIIDGVPSGPQTGGVTQSLVVTGADLDGDEITIPPPGILGSPSINSSALDAGETAVRTSVDDTFGYGAVINGIPSGPQTDGRSITKVYQTVIAEEPPTNDEGELTDIWNIDEESDGQAVGVVPKGPIHFVGIASAPWGEPAVYFTAAGVGGSSLWVLDFFSRKVYPIRIGLELQITDARIWNGHIMVTDGWNAYAYDAHKGETTNIGLPRIDGVPDSLLNPSLRIANLVPSDQYLYAILRTTDLTTALANPAFIKMRLACFNNRGWHLIGDSISGFLPVYGAMAAYEAQSPPVRRLHAIGKSTANNLTIVNWDVPAHSNVPEYNGSYRYQVSGGFITGWMDGGFADIDGVLLKLTIDALNLTSSETVEVSYQLNNNETGAWMPLYDSDGNSGIFNNTTKSLYFQRSKPFQGAEFRTVRFKVILRRGANDKLTPAIRALIFTYIKKPSFRSTWTFTLDLDRMLEAANDFPVDGQPATTARIWQKLISLWNTQTLMSLTIPSIEMSDLNVTTNDMPITFDDFRGAVSGHGTVQLKLLEPISRDAA